VNQETECVLFAYFLHFLVDSCSVCLYSTFCFLVIHCRLRFEERNKKKEAAEVEHVNQQVAVLESAHAEECREG
jgi:hypothetical protein